MRHTFLLGGLLWLPERFKFSLTLCTSVSSLPERGLFVSRGLVFSLLEFQNAAERFLRTIIFFVLRLRLTKIRVTSVFTVAVSGILGIGAFLRKEILLPEIVVGLFLLIFYLLHEQGPAFENL